MEPLSRIELETHPYQGCALPTELQRHLYVSRLSLSTKKLLALYSVVVKFFFNIFFGGTEPAFAAADKIHKLHHLRQICVVVRKQIQASERGISLRQMRRKACLKAEIVSREAPARRSPTRLGPCTSARLPAASIHGGKILRNAPSCRPRKRAYRHGRTGALRKGRR